MDAATRQLEPAGYRCCECGRLDAESNQPCTQHGDVEQVYRVIEAPADGPAAGEPTLWSIRCFQCDNNAFHTTTDKTVAVAWRGVHRNNHPGHDVRLICIPGD